MLTREQNDAIFGPSIHVFRISAIRGRSSLINRQVGSFSSPPVVPLGKESLGYLRVAVYSGIRESILTENDPILGCTILS
jgi:hypothetical protein